MKRPVSLASSPRAVSTPDQRVSGVLWESGTSDPASPLIVCVHGIGSNGRYFDLQSNSLAVAAAMRGISTLLVDRPGYGKSAEPASGLAIDCGVEAINALVQVVRGASIGKSERQLVLIGHSFGGAIALTYAARQPAGCIAAICVSGIGDRPAVPYLEEMERQAIEGSQQLSPHWFFGPGSTFDRHGVTALRVATEPQRANEVHEVAYLWPAKWPSVAPKITCPVHVRLAEFERIWQATPSDIARLGDALTLAPQVDAAILPGGGHLYEAHLRGNELVAAQLDFVQNRTRKMM